MAETLTFSADSAALLEPHLPPKDASQRHETGRPFTTVTFATSLDSQLALAPGVRTQLSGHESKCMTHFLRTRHKAILIGVGTVLADDPGLNCRIAGATTQPRPIVLDPHCRWKPKRSDKVFRVSREDAALAPFVITGLEASQVSLESAQVLQEHGGKYIHIPSRSNDGGRMRFDWNDILAALHAEKLDSVMVEGGGQVINTLLDSAYHGLVDSVIVTFAPTWLGKGGVVVSPDRVTDSEGTPVAAARLTQVKWIPFGQDVVLCGRLH